MADEKVIRLFLNLAPLQFIDVSVPTNVNFNMLINMWRSQQYLMTDKDFIEWHYVIGVRELPIPAPIADIQAEKVRLN